MKTFRFLKAPLTLLAAIIMAASIHQSHAQVALTGTSYLETFDGIGTALPAGWSVYTGASSSTLGTATTAGTTPLSWDTSTGGFRNSASFTVGPSNTTAAAQSTATDRSLSIRQTGTVGDPGAAFAVEIQNTTGFTNFVASLDFALLSSQTRSTVWTVDYGIGAAPTSFTPVTNYADPGFYTNKHVTVSFGSTLDNLSQPVWIRVVALSASTGSGSRDTFGIDNFQLTYGQGVPADAPAHITTQPVGVTNSIGGSATFTVSATGTSLNYQWWYTNAPVNYAIDGATGPNYNIPVLDLTNSGGYYVVVANGLGSVTSSVANLFVQGPIFTNMAYLHSLEDPVNFAPTDTTTTWLIRGQVTSYVNMSTPNNKEFFMQDASGGMEVFRAASSLFIPNNGDYVEVTGKLLAFNGAMEFTPLSDSSITVLSNSPTLPTPLSFNFASSNNIPFMESIEGRMVIAHNVFIDTTTGTYVSASNVNMTNAAGVPFILRIDARATSVIGQPIPSGPVDVTGIVQQFDSAAPFTDGYEIFLLQPTDVVTSTGGGTTPGNPRITSIVSTPSGLVVSGTNGTVSGTYVVYTSTNITTALGSWTSGPTYGFDGTGNFSFTNAPAGAAQFITIQQQP